MGLVEGETEMTNRTAAQFAADRRRSHKAKAKKEQRMSAWCYQQHLKIPGLCMVSHAITARMARSHLNYLMTGQYADFV